MKFLDSLMNYDKDNIAPRIMQKLKDQILNDENFDPDKVKTASTAAEGSPCSLNNTQINESFNLIAEWIWQSDMYSPATLNLILLKMALIKKL